MKTLHLIFLACAGIAAQAQNNFNYLDINQVKAGILSHGVLHRDPTNSNNAYEVPVGSGKHSNALSSLWFGGMSNNQLHVSAQLNPMPGLDFNSGPLTISGNCLVTDSAKYMKVWKLNRADIDAFLYHFANGNVQNGTYIPVPDLLSWPGNGDITKEQAVILAPFMDVNSDAVYDPYSGDYPIIKGDQALYFIYNDVTASPHASGGASMGLEIHGMAYAYGTCSVVAANPVLNYTTFYDYTIINRSTKTYSDFYIGLHSEADLGQFADDYIGCDAADQYGYVYNGDADDQPVGAVTGYGTNPPAAAFVMLRTPDSNSDGIDNDADGMVDEPGEQMGMTNFSYFLTAFPGIPAGMYPPSNAIEYYNYMRSTWKDGTPFTCDAANGYGGTIATPYAFPGTTYANASACGAANWSETGAPGDRRYIMSTKHYSFQPGEHSRFEFAHVTSFPSAGSALSQLDLDVNSLKTFFQSGASNSCVATGVSESPEANAFNLYPNPASSDVLLSFKSLQAGNIELSDVYGKVLLSSAIENRESMRIDVSALASGIYFVKVSAEGKGTVRKFVKE